MTATKREIFLLSGAVLATVAVELVAHWKFTPELISRISLLCIYIIISLKIVIITVKDFSRKVFFTEFSLMSIATIGAFIVGQEAEAIAVMIFYRAGELISDMISIKSRAAISDLLALRPDTARVKTATGWQVQPADSVLVGDQLLVQAGERVAVDGVISKGHAFFDTQAITGEAVPREFFEGDEVLATYILLDQSIEMTVVKSAEQSSASTIINLIVKAQEAKSTHERFITSFARIYTPLVFAAACVYLLITYFFGGLPFTQALYQALILLAISCPCALMISVPLSYLGGLGGLARHGILIKGANILDQLTHVGLVVFDKTGTLTQGKFTVRTVQAREGYSEEQVIHFAGLAQAHSAHPIAKSILSSAKERGQTIKSEDLIEAQELAGLGIIAKSAQHKLVVGSHRLLERENITYTNFENPEELALTQVLVAVDDQHIGSLTLGDVLKPDAAQAICELKKVGITNLALLSGDRPLAAQSIAQTLDIPTVFAELKPADKLHEFEKMIAALPSGRKAPTSIFVGDGINDAAVLSRADVGIAMGQGTDLTINCADIVLMADRPLDVSRAIKQARFTRLIASQNIFGSLIVKAVFLVLAALGIATMWEAVITDVGVTIVAALNAVRANRMK